MRPLGRSCFHCNPTSVPTNLVGTVASTNIVGIAIFICQIKKCVRTSVPTNLVGTMVPTNLVGTMVPTNLVVTMVPTKFAETIAPTNIVETHPQILWN